MLRLKNPVARPQGIKSKIAYVVSCHSCESRNPDAVPVKTGSYVKELGSHFHGKPWIPHEVRNDKKIKVTLQQVVATRFLSYREYTHCSF